VVAEPSSGDWVRRPAPSLTAARIWRVVRTGLAFAYYGVGSLALAFVVLPLQSLAARLAGSAERPDLRAQRTICAGSRSFVAFMERLGLLRLEFPGAEALGKGPLLVVANHPSLIDTPILSSRMPQADFIVSPEWGRNPFFRRAVDRAHYLHADGDGAVVDEAVSRLREGRCVVVYPEGSRTPPEGLRPFQRGAAHIALEAGCDLLPVLIRVAPRTLMKGQHWTDTPQAVPVWRVEVGEPIRPREHVDEDAPRSVAARRLTAVLQDHFEKGWELGRI
jgi:1-acyl-sn-glycerol-3-phosphate acyltransferase